MSNTETQLEVKQPKVTALDLMADRLSVDSTKLFATLKATCFKGATNEEMLALVAVSNRYGLDPLTKQIYAFPSKGGITPVVSVDGWLHILNSQPQFDGIEFLFEDGADGKPMSVTAVVYRKDRSRPTKVTEYFAECARATEPWKQFPRRMLRHKAVKEAVRVAFGISGITDEDEARDIAKNAVAFEKVRVEPKAIEQPKVVVEEPKVIDAEVVTEKPLQISYESEGVEAWPEELVANEEAVNAFLIAKEQIAEGQTFRDLKEGAYKKRVLANVGKFLEAVLGPKEAETFLAKFAEQKEAA